MQSDSDKNSEYEINADELYSDYSDNEDAV